MVSDLELITACGECGTTVAVDLEADAIADPACPACGAVMPMLRKRPWDGDAAGASAIDRHIGAAVRYRRLLLGWSTETLGTRAEISADRLAGLEQGRRKIAPEELLRLSRALGVTLGDLMA